MRLLAVLVVAFAACRAAPAPHLPSNVSHGQANTPPEPRERAIPRELFPDLALVRSLAHQHDAVSREGLEAGGRVFEQIRWTGMSADRVVALLGEPTTRDAQSWRYDLEYSESDLHARSVFLKLRFANGEVEGAVHGDSEVRITPVTH